MALREADCCYTCKQFRCEKWSCFGDCLRHPNLDVYFHTICDDFEKRDGELLFKEDIVMGL